MKDLTRELQAVYRIEDVETKRQAMYTLIENSHATAETKRKAVNDVERMRTVYQIDKFATNYVLSGEGMKVRG